MTPQELQHIAPILAKLQQHSAGFSIPENYFDTIENAVIDDIFFTTLPDSSGYTIPENYFEQLENKLTPKLEVPEEYFDKIEDKVFERLAVEAKPKVYTLRKYWIPAVIAASLLLLVYVYNPFDTKQILEVAEIEKWIDEGNLEVNSYEIAEAFNDDLDDLNIENSIDKIELENYINNEFSEESFYN